MVSGRIDVILMHHGVWGTLGRCVEQVLTWPTIVNSLFRSTIVDSVEGLAVAYQRNAPV